MHTNLMEEHAMGRCQLVFALLLGAFALQVDAGQEQPPLKDLYGDPLPANALARLGSVRWLHKNALFAAFLPDGKTVVTVGGDGTIRLWEFPTGKEQSRIPLRAEPERGYGNLTGIALNKDGKTIATQTGAGEISLHDLGNRKELTPLKWAVQEANAGSRFPTSKLTFSPGGKHLAALDIDGTMRIWDWVSSKLLHQFQLNTYGGTFVYAPDGKSIAACDTSREAVKLMNAQTGAFLWRFKPINNDFLMDIAFSPDGNTLAVLGADDVYLVDAQTGNEIRKLATGRKPSSHVFCHDSTKLYLTTRLPGGSRLLEVEVATGKVLRECAADYGMPSLSPDGRTLVLAGSGSNGPLFFNLAPGKPMAPLYSASTPLRTVQFSADGKSLLTTRNASQAIQAVQRWNAGTGEDLGPVPFPLSLTYLAASPDGKLFVGNDRSIAGGFGPRKPSKDVNIIDAASGKEIGTISLQAPEPNLSACFTPDGKTLALRQPGEGKIELYDVAGPRLRLSLTIAKAPVTTKGKGIGGLSAGLYGDVVISPDGKMLAALADQNTMAVWDTVTGKRIGSLAPAAGQGGFSDTVTFSPDCRCLAVEMNDGTAALYELSTGQLRRNVGKQKAGGKLLMAGGARYYAEAVAGPRFAFAPDGKAIAQAGPDGIVYLWDVLHAHEPATFKGHAEEVAAVAFAPHSKLLASASADGTTLIWDAARVHRATPPAQKPKAGDLESWWEALAGADAVKAFAAMTSLAEAPEQAVAWIKDHVKPVPALDEKLIQNLIAQLDHKEFKMRFRAASELLRMGEQIIPALDKALKANLPPDRKNHLEDLRSKATPELVMQGERLREFRAVEVLEFMGTPQARQVLESLAGGSRGALLTISANATLKRM
jgi:WD40 repeat protein